MTRDRLIRVGIADDHPFVRRGLRGFLDREARLEVVGEAADGAGAVALAASTRPDVMLMDLVMPGMDGVEATRRIAADIPDVRVIVLTSFASPDDVMPAVEAGAAGYLLKDVEPDDLVAAIIAVHRGQTLWAREVVDELRAHVARRRAERRTPPAEGRAAADRRRGSPGAQGEAEAGRQRAGSGRAAADRVPTAARLAPGGPTGTAPGHAAVSTAERRALDRLTPREQEVLVLLGRGRSNADIAAALVLSEKTVKTHVSHILSKLHVDDRTQAAVLAVRAGLVG